MSWGNLCLVLPLNIGKVTSLFWSSPGKQDWETAKFPLVHKPGDQKHIFLQGPLSCVSFYCSFKDNSVSPVVRQAYGTCGLDAF